MLKFFDRLNLNPSERRLVVVIAAIAFLVLNYWLVWPRFDDYSQITEDMTALRVKRDLYEREIARRPTYELTLRKLQAEGSVLPPGEERIQFRSDMERLAREVGLSVPKWSQVLPERASGSGTNAFFEAITLTMNQVSGSEAQIVDFLYRVGASNSTIRVKDLTLTTGPMDRRAQGPTNLVAGLIKLVASVQKSDAPKPAASAVPARTESRGAAASTGSASEPTRTNVPIPTRTVTNRPPGRTAQPGS